MLVFSCKLLAAFQSCQQPHRGPQITKNASVVVGARIIYQVLGERNVSDYFDLLQFGSSPGKQHGELTECTFRIENWEMPRASPSSASLRRLAELLARSVSICCIGWWSYSVVSKKNSVLFRNEAIWPSRGLRRKGPNLLSHFIVERANGR